MEVEGVDTFFEIFRHCEQLESKQNLQLFVWIFRSAPQLKIDCA